MTHQVPWNDNILEKFIKLALLTEDEEFIIRTRVKGWSQVKQAMELGCGTATVSKIVRRLKDKYDSLVEHYPEEFPTRTKSNIETQLDNIEKDLSSGNIILCETCTKDLSSMNAIQLVECAKNCHYRCRIKN